MWSGSKVISIGSINVETFTVWENSEFRSLFPGSGDWPHVSFSVGDNAHSSWNIFGALQANGSSSASNAAGISGGDVIMCQCARAVTGMVRVNYVVVANDQS